MADQIYTTQEGDRWDLLAYRFLGSPARYRELIQANPTAPVVVILRNGMRLTIPARTDRVAR